MAELPKTKAYFEEREKLPSELRDDFDNLIKWYRYYGVVHSVLGLLARGSRNPRLSGTATRL